MSFPTDGDEDQAEQEGLQMTLPAIREDLEAI